jgi:hypothetical protein
MGIVKGTGFGHEALFKGLEARHHEVGRKKMKLRNKAMAAIKAAAGQVPASKAQYMKHVVALHGDGFNPDFAKAEEAPTSVTAYWQAVREWAGRIRRTPAGTHVLAIDSSNVFFVASVMATDVTYEKIQDVVGEADICFCY